MERRLFSFVVVLVLLSQFMVGLPTGAAIGRAAEPPPPEGQLEDAESLVKTAIEQALSIHQDQILAYVIYQEQVERVEVSADGQWASAMLVLSDPQTGEPLPSEPGLVFARLQDGQWMATLPSDPEWLDLLKTAPPDLLDDELRQVWLEMYSAEQANIPDAPLTGYYLPWEVGKTVYLSRSVAHSGATSRSWKQKNGAPSFSSNSNAASIFVTVRGMENLVLTAQVVYGEIKYLDRWEGSRKARITGTFGSVTFMKPKDSTGKLELQNSSQMVSLQIQEY